MRLVRSILVWALVGTGTTMIAAPVLTYATGSLRQARLASEVRTLLGPETEVAIDRFGEPGPSPSPAPEPNTGGEHRPTANPASEPAAAESARPAGREPNPAPTLRTPRNLIAARPVEGQPLGIIRIPSIGVDVAFLEGVSDETLLVGPGHLPGTALPGTGDVSVLAAHRDMHFRHLKDVEVGDRVQLRMPGRTVIYEVVRLTIAHPTDTWVTQLRGRPMLRLVTCWPPNYLGPAPDRLVVTALPLDEDGNMIETGPRLPEPATDAPATPRPEPGRADQAPAAESPASRASQSPKDQPALDSSAFLAVPQPASDAMALPRIGSVGATVAVLAAFGAWRSRRRLAWWFLPWVGGMGVVTLALLAAWGGPLLG
jgi:LPXTG-site transpeptidase (sortase) family protein